MSKNEESNPKSNEHMTEKEKMLACLPYNPTENDLYLEMVRASELVEKYNALYMYKVLRVQDFGDKEGRQKILYDLLNPACRGRKFYFEAPFRVNFGYNLTVGDGFFANFDCVFLDSAPITFGNNCMLGPGVNIYASTHPTDPKIRRDSQRNNMAYPAKIGNNVWIGGKAIIVSGVTIVTVAGGSVVVKGVPSNVLVGGNPARVIRQLNDD